MKALPIALLMSAFFVTNAYAQSTCFPYAIGSERLKDKYGEKPVGRGVSCRGQCVVEFWHNPETGTVTFLSVNTDGIACILGAGREWQDGPFEATEQGTAL